LVGAVVLRGEGGSDRGRPGPVERHLDPRAALRVGAVLATAAGDAGTAQRHRTGVDTEIPVVGIVRIAAGGRACVVERAGAVGSERARGADIVVDAQGAACCGDVGAAVPGR